MLRPGFHDKERHESPMSPAYSDRWHRQWHRQKSDMSIGRFVVKQSMADANVPSSVKAGVGDNEVGVVVMAVFLFV
jgi:hypothetical protein